MKKALSGKLIAGIIGGVAAVAAVVVTAVMLLNGDGYRTIKVYQLTGSAVVTRQGNMMDAVENMMLISDDSVRTGNGSNMYLKMDEDKYLLAEQNTIFSLEALGDSQNSKTRINLEYGKISNDIRNPLSSDSVYEVETPNAVMAVRGTFFIAKYYRDENGEYVTEITTLEGKVEAWVKDKDGNLSDTSIWIVAGNRDEIRTFFTVDDMQAAEQITGEKILVTIGERAAFEPGPIEVEEFNPEEIQFILDSINRGMQPEGITPKELEAALRQKQTIEPTPAPTPTPGAEPTAEPTETPSAEPSPEPTEEPSAEPTAEPTATPSTEPTEAPTPESTATPTPTPKPTATPMPTPTPMPEAKVYTVTYKYGAEVLFTENVEANKTATGPQTTPTQNGHWDKDLTKPVTANMTVNWVKDGPDIYTVTFMYNNTVFSTMTVEEGKTVQAPETTPTTYGKWDSELTVPVNSDLTLNWIDNTVTVTFRNEGNVIQTREVEKGQKVSDIPDNPTQNGHWDKDLTQPVTADMTVNWIADIFYTVRFMYDGEELYSETVKSGEKVTGTVNNPTIYGEWDTDYSGAITKDMTVNWIEKYPVVFQYQGEVFDTQLVARGSTVTAPATPTPYGKWDTDLSQAVTSEMTVEWIRGILVEYKVDGVTISSGMAYPYLDERPMDPEGPGQGWWEYDELASDDNHEVYYWQEVKDEL